MTETDVEKNNSDSTEKSPARQRILRSTAVLPSMVTLMNALAGFGAIHFATKQALGPMSDQGVSNLNIAAWLLALSMLCDMLDGRLARMTRKTSDFGAQLDSLCDAISFGLAPAVIALRLVFGLLYELGELGVDWNLERVMWSVAAIYVACAVLRLARFNVENEPDESAHMGFRGLPTPGAAAAIAALTLMFVRSTRLLPEWRDTKWFLITALSVLMVITLSSALLMVSRFKYIHLVNHYIRGRKPFSYLVKLVLIVPLIIWQPIVTIAVFTNVYALSGPVRSGLLYMKKSRSK